MKRSADPADHIANRALLMIYCSQLSEAVGVKIDGRFHPAHEWHNVCRQVRIAARNACEARGLEPAELFDLVLDAMKWDKAELLHVQSAALIISRGLGP